MPSYTIPTQGPYTVTLPAGYEINYFIGPPDSTPIMDIVLDNLCQSKNILKTDIPAHFINFLFLKYEAKLLPSPDAVELLWDAYLLGVNDLVDRMLTDTETKK